MNAVRIRKENQVYSAEEKRALAQLNFEEKAKREAQTINKLRELLNNRMNEAEAKVAAVLAQQQGGTDEKKAAGEGKS